MWKSCGKVRTSLGNWRFLSRFNWFKYLSTAYAQVIHSLAEFFHRGQTQFIHLCTDFIIITVFKNKIRYITNEGMWI